MVSMSELDITENDGFYLSFIGGRSSNSLREVSIIYCDKDLC
jgi:hypothetical protein